MSVPTLATEERVGKSCIVGGGMIFIVQSLDLIEQRIKRVKDVDSGLSSWKDFEDLLALSPLFGEPLGKASSLLVLGRNVMVLRYIAIGLMIPPMASHGRSGASDRGARWQGAVPTAEHLQSLVSSDQGRGNRREPLQDFVIRKKRFDIMLRKSREVLNILVTFMVRGYLGDGDDDVTRYANQNLKVCVELQSIWLQRRDRLQLWNELQQYVERKVDNRLTVARTGIPD